MIGNRCCNIEPRVTNDDTLIQKSTPTIISKQTCISVPLHYKAIAYIDQKALFRIEPCTKKPFVKNYGKEYIGKQLTVAFIANCSLAQAAWGFGNIHINNEALNEVYTIGVNGKVSIEIIDYAKLIKAFPGYEYITLKQVREKMISTLKASGTPILGVYFTESTVSVLEMSTLISDFRERFMNVLAEEPCFAEMGIKLASFSVDGFFVNEDDLEIIKKRKN